MTRRWPLDPPDSSAGSPIVDTVAAPTPVEAIPISAVFMPHLLLEGAIDGVNTVFTSPVPFISGDIVREVVYAQGVRVDPSQYTVDPATRTLTFLQAPVPPDVLTLDAYVETAQ